MKKYKEFIRNSKNKYLNNSEFRKRSDYYDALTKNKVDEKIILYEAYFGRGLICNSFAIFDYLFNDERFNDYIHVWSLEESEFSELVKKDYKNCKNVLFVETFSKAYFKYLSCAKYLINNVTWQNYFIKKKGQVLINTWHGIPMKHIGYDTPGGALEAENAVRNFLMTDYLLSGSAYNTDLLKKAYKLEGLFEGKIVEAGLPRIDNTIRSDKERLAKILFDCGVKYDPSKKLILYAPTFRGAYANATADASEYNLFINTLENYIDSEEYQILFKPHQIVYKALLNKGLLQNNYIPAVIDTNMILGAVDILVSDYSSIAFDFLVTRRPVLFYIPDLDKYQEDRGVYVTIDELPGPITTELEQIGKWIAQIEQYKTFFDYSKYEKTLKKYAGNEDGNSCKRVIDAVFFNDNKYIKRVVTNKIKILIHLDVYLKNGLSSAAVNLLNNIDKRKYDVSFYTSGKKNELKNYYDAISDEVRILNRVGSRVCNIRSDARVDYCIEKAITYVDGKKIFPIDFYRYEYKRIFGDSKFDYIVYFSGTSAFWANLYSVQPNKKLIWMHNVISREYDRPVNGEYIFKRNFNNIFKLYPVYDACVSCSKATMKQNVKDLSQYNTKSNFGFARNLMDPTYISSKIEAESVITIEGRTILADIVSEGNAMMIPLPSEEKISFINVGRLTKEKNQVSLVRAFKKIVDEYEDVELFLVGEGEYASEVKKTILQNHLSQHVHMVGNVNNPFSIMKRCNCFVLPSYYEGQPMVIMEARMLKLPLIISDFSTVEDCMLENGQIIVKTDVDSIYRGMKQFMEGRVNGDYIFSIEKYNEEGINEFENCLKLADKKRSND